MILDRIVAQKRLEIAQLKSAGIALPPSMQGKKIDPPRGFRQALVAYPGVSIIAEVKKASPSKGVICEDFDPVEIAGNYQRSGAQAISVLTDRQFFQGSLLYLMQVREAVILPVLRKDFIIDEVQIREAGMHGADAILLIAAILDALQLKEYQVYAGELGMDVLVEVHDEREVELALAADSRLIGINNRNLKDFSMDINTTFRLKKIIPADIPVVSESGLRDHEDIERLAEAGVAAALIGETLMRAGSPGDVLRGLR
ncbi:indole-3-glycerol phosphate synthase TrpC [Desulfoprunum benzoelyticum]|uniref:Indole-3-glycerol phosphate synthase n=1 Tax=Desulfoprunum benzoelyticum TaxID=1506996 RepID=A0A840V0Z1_9BACT|nr:indole-3-glycerol phosphate synthase TrpC [Desulfoprunum benzoelyticum]MBB5349344.1 indole-3-glycerol phosphate synthase [Desulfoprunum benzoelyticum]MBM9531080.1 indole-3-glycerol phosphate synthase TrpC [Desulfoprunum benzoelyticum]